MMSNSVSNYKYIVVLGSSGFIGSVIENRLQNDEQYEVTGYTSKSCNLLDREQLEKVVSRWPKETTVVFCSAITRRRDNSLDSMWANLSMIQNLIGANTGCITNVIFLSSAEVYGVSGKETLCERTPPAPDGYYDLSKWMSELVLNQWAKDNIVKLSVLRLPGVYGKGDQRQSIIGQFCTMIADGKTLSLNGGGKVLRDYIHVDDVVNVVRYFIDHPCSATVNVVTGQSSSLLEIAQMIEINLNTSANVMIEPKRSKRDFDLVFEESALHSIFKNWSPISIKQGVKKYINEEGIVKNEKF